jgi:hypothetical protein
MADRKISDLTALTTPASGDYLPIVDISEVAAASKNKRITIEELMRGAPDGTAAAPSIAFESDPNTGIYSPGADQLAVSTGGTGRLFVDSSGTVGIGTSSPGAALQVLLASSYAPGAAWDNKTVAFGGTSSTSGAVGIAYDDTNGGYIASISPGSSWKPLTLRGSVLVLATDVAGERVRVDSSGRLLVGTSSAVAVGGYGAEDIQSYVQSGGAAASIAVISTGNNANASALHIAKSRGGTSTIVNNDDTIGAIRFSGADGTDLLSVAAEIFCLVDGIPGTDDMPGRLVFSTTADGAATPTERLRITSAGVLQVADAGNIAVGTTTGTKIGTATTQKLGFYNATPVVQPTAVADATDAATVITQLNALLTRMRNLGLIAT